MPETGPTATAGRAATSERRPLTILFADIAGSTTIAEKLAPEDDPERAVRCGLDMVREIEGLGTDPHGHHVPLQVRVGINTGPVVVGMVGSDIAHEYTAMGDAVNIAARMQASAPPGGVLITAATYKFVAPLVEVTDAGRLELKGKAEAVHGYQVTALKRGAVSTRGLGDDVRSTMIGRDAQ